MAKSFIFSAELGEWLGTLSITDFTEACICALGYGLGKKEYEDYARDEIALKVRELIDAANGRKKRGSMEVYREIVDYLNDKAGTAFRASSAKTQSLIEARLNQGFTPADFYRVIDCKSDEWRGTEFDKYLCPETLFGSKFEKYLNQKHENKNSSFDTDSFYNAALTRAYGG